MFIHEKNIDIKIEYSHKKILSKLDEENAYSFLKKQIKLQKIQVPIFVSECSGNGKTYQAKQNALELGCHAFLEITLASYNDINLFSDRVLEALSFYLEQKTIWNSTSFKNDKPWSNKIAIHINIGLPGNICNQKEFKTFCNYSTIFILILIDFLH